ncbi:MAG: transglycosylase domain-containing protein [Pseudomonadota bacterium]
MFFLWLLWWVSLQVPPASFLLYDREGRFLAEAGADPVAGYGYWPLEELPFRVVAATQAIEDQRFWQHPGVDLLAVGRALWQNLSQGRRVSGASTLAMQIVHLQAPGVRGYWCKAWEAWQAVALTLRYGREQVLRHYLTLVPYGNHIHGIRYAARRYFGKPVADLSWAEIALLSAIPQAPSRMNPLKDSGRVRAVARGQRILARLREHGLLSQVDHALAERQLNDLRITATAQRPNDALHAILALERQLARDRPTLVAHGHFVIRTSLDLEIQRQVSGLARRVVRAGMAQGLDNAAAIVLEPATQAVRAWLGSVNYFEQDRGRTGAIDFVTRPRSPGSTLKPFIYALALERGVITAASVLDDLPLGAAGMVNADRDYLGPLLPRQALANSRNVPAALLLKTVGLDVTYGFLKELGLHVGRLPASQYGLGLSVGALPVTLADLARAYGVLANDGEQRDLLWYEGQPLVPPVRRLSPASARQITGFLADPMNRLPSFPQRGSTQYAFPVAVKTGTSQGYRDAWTLAWSRRFLVGVWLGNAQARPMTQVTGASAAATLAQQLLLALHPAQRGGLEDLVFPTPNGYRPVRLCATSGKLATPSCGQVFEEWLAPGTIPQEYDDTYVTVAVDVRNGLLAHPGIPPGFVERRTFLNLPPRYAEWGASLPRLPERFSPLDESTGTVPPVSAGVLVPENPPRLHIVMPEEGLRLVRDPEVPPDASSMALRVVVQPRVAQVLWWVDDKPFQLADYPYTVRWPLSVGEHHFQARIPYTGSRSQRIRIRVE